MSNPTSIEQSWWMKVKRANQHLAAITDLVDRVHRDNPRAIRVAARQEAGRWIYTAHHDLTIDPMLTVTLGEFLFDLRSALDHIAAANVPAERIRKSQFPIFTDDIWQTGPNGTYVDRFADQRRQWDRWTKGMPSAVVDIIKLAQPYENATKYSANPDDHALAILNEYQNADKHRELNIISLGIEDPHATVTWPTGLREEIDYRNAPPGTLMSDGARCFASDDPVKIDLSGTVRIAMARGHRLAHRELPGSLALLFGTVGDTLALIQDAMLAAADATTDPSI